MLSDLFHLEIEHHQEVKHQVSDKDLLDAVVGEVDVLHDDLAAQPRVRDRALRPVGSFLFLNCNVFKNKSQNLNWGTLLN